MRRGPVRNTRHDRSARAGRCMTATSVKKTADRIVVAGCAMCILEDSGTARAPRRASARRTPKCRKDRMYKKLAAALTVGSLTLAAAAHAGQAPANVRMATLAP